MTGATTGATTGAAHDLITRSLSQPNSVRVFESWRQAAQAVLEAESSGGDINHYFQATCPRTRLRYLRYTLPYLTFAKYVIYFLRAKHPQSFQGLQHTLTTSFSMRSSQQETEDSASLPSTVNTRSNS